MSQVFKLSDKALLEDARAASVLNSRSIAGQIEHWVRISHAIERSPEFNYARVTQALMAQTSPDALSLSEQEVYFDELSADLWNESGKDDALFWQNRRQRGLGVGTDQAGNIVRQKPAP
ncbi:MAG: ParD-like family protein [Pseudomonadales bacterium]|jgi:hypothetical protein|nr:ParD-like family protein [Pseudomonadales bacterium]